jgi:hypothetical protein
MRIERTAYAWQRGARVLALALFLLTGIQCAPIRLVADYQQATLDETLRLAQDVDAFYLTMLETDERPYAPYAERYIAIEAALGSHVLREESRPLNTESARIAEIILGRWQAYRARHRTSGGYPDARFDRMRFRRLFGAAVSAEAAKQLAPADTASPPGDAPPNP